METPTRFEPASCSYEFDVHANTAGPLSLQVVWIHAVSFNPIRYCSGTDPCTGRTLAASGSSPPGRACRDCSDP